MKEKINSLFNKNQWLIKTLICVCAYFCVLSFSKIISLNGDSIVFWGGDYFGYNIISVILFIVTVWLLWRFVLQRDSRRKAYSCAGGLLLAVAITYGAYAHYTNDIFTSMGDTFLQIGMILSIASLTVPLVAEMFSWLNRIPGIDKIEVSRKHPIACFFIAWVSIFCCYIPLFLAWWPGNFVFDAKYQMQNVIEGWYNTHHPLIHTLMMGKAYELGQAVGNVSWGYQFYTLAQMLILTSSFAYTLQYMYKKNVKTVWLIFTWCFFAIFPMHSVFSISATKDVLCAAFFLYFMVFLVRYVFDKESFKPISYIGMIVTGGLLALFRNNALYAVLITGIILIISIKGFMEKGKILLIFVGVYLFATLVNNGLISYTNATSGDTYRETLCVPLQCLARVASYRGDELEDAVYSEICQYMREEDIVSYNPYLADTVKNNANEELLKSNTVNFIKLWLKVGLKFPDEYLESMITNTLGYWYPLNQGMYVSTDISLYHTLIGMGDEIEKVNYCDWAYNIYAPLFWEGKYHNTPILGYLFRNAPYVWLIIFFVLWSLYKKRKERFLVGILPLIYLATCFCGPMAALRYIYSIVVCVPLIVYMIVVRNGER